MRTIWRLLLLGLAVTTAIFFRTQAEVDERLLVLALLVYSIPATGLAYRMMKRATAAWRWKPRRRLIGLCAVVAGPLLALFSVIIGFLALAMIAANGLYRACSRVALGMWFATPRSWGWRCPFCFVLALLLLDCVLFAALGAALPYPELREMMSGFGVGVVLAGVVAVGALLVCWWRPLAAPRVALHHTVHFLTAGTFIGVLGIFGRNPSLESRPSLFLVGLPLLAYALYKIVKWRQRGPMGRDVVDVILLSLCLLTILAAASNDPLAMLAALRSATNTLGWGLALSLVPLADLAWASIRRWRAPPATAASAS